jgi:nickel/cobalt transporter (NiCoT) family protein
MSHSFLGLALLFGCRHGLDPDHLAAIDGLARVRANPWNGLLFAFGHGLVVTLLAAGVGRLSFSWMEPLAPWLLIAIGTFNLFRLVKRGAHHRHYVFATTSPILLGIIFAAGFETASQLSALALVHQKNAWLVGGMFTLGMITVDGLDGLNALKVQRNGRKDSADACRISNYLSLVVVLSSYTLGISELAGVNMDNCALPSGIALFMIVLSLRVWHSFANREAESQA